MGQQKRDRLELRFYELPPNESALALLGDAWVGPYGLTDSCPHFHNLMEIGVCRSGRGLLTLGDRELVYEGGMFSAIPAGCPHITVSEDIDSWEFLFFDPAELLLEMYPDKPHRQAELLAVISEHAELYSREEQPQLFALVQMLLEESRRKDPLYREAVNQLLKVFLLALVRLHAARDADEYVSPRQAARGNLSPILPALHHMALHFAENIRAEELARRCGLSEAHFRRVFTANLNMAPMDYLNLIRVQNACKLMRSKNSSMELIAAECGFASVSTFTRNFRKYLGTTPYQWKTNPDSFRSRLLDNHITVQKGWDSL